MAKKNKPPDSGDLPRLTEPRADVQKQIRARIEKAGALMGLSTETQVELVLAEGEYKKWDDYNKAMLKKLFESDEILNEYAQSSGIYHDPEATFYVRVAEFVSSAHQSFVALQSIEERLELFDEATAEQALGPQRVSGGRGFGTPVSRAPLSGTDVFIVHGHDEGARDSVARFIQTLDLNPIVLHEKPGKGRTIIKKLEDEASPAGYAVILLTADDTGASKEKPEDTKPRARQNVILELGFFVGKLGRGRVCALHKEHVEIPSDMLGVEYVAMDPAGAWKTKLAQEMRSAGLEFDAEKVLGL